METSGAYPFAAASAVLPVEIIGRRAHGVRDMARWERSEAVADVAAFVDRMNAVAKRHDHRSPVPADVGRNVDATMAVLGHVADWAAEYEPVNDDLFTVAPSYRRFHDRLRADGYRLLIRTYGRPGDHRTVELPAYFERSFGDPETNAYGLEHELSFSMFLVALFKLHCLTSADERHVVAVLFDRYGEKERPICDVRVGRIDIHSIIVCFGFREKNSNINGPSKRISFEISSPPPIHSPFVFDSPVPFKRNGLQIKRTVCRPKTERYRLPGFYESRFGNSATRSLGNFLDVLLIRPYDHFVPIRYLATF